MSDLRNAGPSGANLLFAADASRQIASGELRAETLVADCLARIRARDPRIGAWVSIDDAHALEQARALDRELDENAYIRPGLGDAGDRIFGTVGA